MEKVEKKLIPYSVYLPKEYHDRISLLAKKRQASSMIRNAICEGMDGGDQRKHGYNQALKDLKKAISKIAIFKEIAYKGKYIDTLILEILEQLEM